MFFHFFKFDNLSNFVGTFVGFFSLLIIIYSIGFMRRRKRLIQYYAYIILTLVCSLGAVFANHLILFMVFWGFLGLLLYLLIGFEDKERTPATAKKAFIIIAGSDALMLLGLAFAWQLTGTLQIDQMNIALNNKMAVFAYLCFAAGAFAKAGAMPLHTWVPDTAEDAPTPVTAYLPASLDKLLGIYFLARISLNMFQMNLAMNTVLRAVGSITIVAAVMMALIQHDLKRLLGYLAVSSAGYMILGLGTANSVGIAGGLFYMLNSAICIGCLFMCCGGAEKNTGTTDLERLGGLAKIMPISFISFLVASLAISGVPPFNGFVSKWMIYQGVIATAKEGSRLWVIWLLAAMFGSALTLASFMKAIFAVFLGQPSIETRNQKPVLRLRSGLVLSRVEAPETRVKEVGPTMWIPQVFLASLCIVFGVFAYRIPIALFIAPSVQGTISYTGIWGATVATVLVLIGLIIGGIIYWLGGLAKTQRETGAFVGGEVLEEYPPMRASGVDFYNTIKDVPLLNKIYQLALNRVFDIYEQLKKLCFVFTKLLRLAHTGILTTYLIWMLLGALILFFVLMR